MKLTSADRLLRVLELAEADEEYQKMKAIYTPGKGWFEKVVNRLPRRLRDKFRTYPYMGYLMHNRVLLLVCEHMKFQDED